MNKKNKLLKILSTVLTFPCFVSSNILAVKGSSATSSSSSSSSTNTSASNNSAFMKKVREYGERRDYKDLLKSVKRFNEVKNGQARQDNIRSVIPDFLCCLKDYLCSEDDNNCRIWKEFFDKYYHDIASSSWYYYDVRNDEDHGSIVITMSSTSGSIQVRSHDTYISLYALVSTSPIQRQSLPRIAIEKRDDNLTNNIWEAVNSILKDASSKVVKSKDFKRSSKLNDKNKVSRRNLHMDVINEEEEEEYDDEETENKGNNRLDREKILNRFRKQYRPVQSEAGSRKNQSKKRSVISPEGYTKLRKYEEAMVSFKTPIVKHEPVIKSPLYILRGNSNGKKRHASSQFPKNNIQEFNIGSSKLRENNNKGIKEVDSDLNRPEEKPGYIYNKFLDRYFKIPNKIEEITIDWDGYNTVPKIDIYKKKLMDSFKTSKKNAADSKKYNTKFDGKTVYQKRLVSSPNDKESPYFVYDKERDMFFNVYTKNNKHITDNDLNLNKRIPWSDRGGIISLSHYAAGKPMHQSNISRKSNSNDIGSVSDSISNTRKGIGIKQARSIVQQVQRINQLTNEFNRNGFGQKHAKIRPAGMGHKKINENIKHENILLNSTNDKNIQNKIDPNKLASVINFINRFDAYKQSLEGEGISLSNQSTQIEEGNSEANPKVNNIGYKFEVDHEKATEARENFKGFCKNKKNMQQNKINLAELLRLTNKVKGIKS